MLYRPQMLTSAGVTNESITNNLLQGGSISFRGSTASIDILHTGHVLLCITHCMMHWRWKACLHFNRISGQASDS